MEKLKKWAEKLNNREYREELTAEEIRELKKDGIIAVYGASDDICLLDGAIIEKLDCYNGGKFVYVAEADKFVQEDYYEDNCEEIIQIDLSERPYIKIKFDSNGWKYELPDIVQVEFNILEDGEQYCEGKLFYHDDFIDWRKKGDE